MPTTDHNDSHERFSRLILESEPVMLRSILVVVPNCADAREIMQETAVALWRQFDSYDPARPFINWAMGFSRPLKETGGRPTGYRVIAHSWYSA
tara:strand:+ start:1545 stop:1826 length:282 start_codon:yes stop_codon:yes gene_type:complete